MFQATRTRRKLVEYIYLRHVTLKLEQCRYQQTAAVSA